MKLATTDSLSIRVQQGNRTVEIAATNDAALILAVGVVVGGLIVLLAAKS